MGRKKIEIKFITDEKNRLVTFAKRKSGLFKKAYELSILCECEIAVLVFTRSNRLYQYGSLSVEHAIQRYSKHTRIDQHLNNEDMGRLTARRLNSTNSVPSQPVSVDEDTEDEEKDEGNTTDFLMHDETCLTNKQLGSLDPLSKSNEHLLFALQPTRVSASSKQSNLPLNIQQPAVISQNSLIFSSEPNLSNNTVSNLINDRKHAIESEFDARQPQVAEPHMVYSTSSCTDVNELEVIRSTAATHLSPISVKSSSVASSCMMSNPLITLPNLCGPNVQVEFEHQVTTTSLLLSPTVMTTGADTPSWLNPDPIFIPNRYNETTTKSLDLLKRSTSACVGELETPPVILTTPTTFNSSFVRPNSTQSEQTEQFISLILSVIPHINQRNSVCNTNNNVSVGHEDHLPLLTTSNTFPTSLTLSNPEEFRTSYLLPEHSVSAQESNLVLGDDLVEPICPPTSNSGTQTDQRHDDISNFPTTGNSNPRFSRCYTDLDNFKKNDSNTAINGNIENSSFSQVSHSATTNANSNTASCNPHRRRLPVLGRLIMPQHPSSIEKYPNSVTPGTFLTPNSVETTLKKLEIQNLGAAIETDQSNLNIQDGCANTNILTPNLDDSCDLLANTCTELVHVNPNSDILPYHPTSNVASITVADCEASSCLLVKMNPPIYVRTSDSQLHLFPPKYAKRSKYL